MANYKKAAIFVIASALATLWPLFLEKWFWPDGLDPGALFIFWPASGVNLALALIFGRRFIPLIFLNAIVIIFVFGEPPIYSLAGAAGNILETFFAYWLLKRFGIFDGKRRSLAPIRMVIGLALVSLIAPLLTGAALTILAMQSGIYPPGTSVNVFLGIAFGNACGIVILAPVILALRENAWRLSGRRIEAAAFALATVLAAWFGFEALFHKEPNVVFLIFVITAFAASRFGWREVALLNFLTLIIIYATMIFSAELLPAGGTSRSLWLVQSFVWILSISSLFIVAQISEQENAQLRLLAEKNVVLDLRLCEERARLSALRHQINPHFLFNALNSIYAALPGNDSGPSAPRKMITHLAGYLRSTLESPPVDLLPLSQEMENAERYLAIERERFGQELQVSIEIAAELRSIPVPVFVLQLLVENAIRHGLEARPGDFLLQITAQLDDEKNLILEVVNTGVWIEKSAESPGGKGLANIRRRLALLYGDCASLKRIKDDSRVRMRLKLPLNPNTLETHLS